LCVQMFRVVLFILSLYIMSGFEWFVLRFMDCRSVKLSD